MEVNDSGVSGPSGSMGQHRANRVTCLKSITVVKVRDMNGLYPVLGGILSHMWPDFSTYGIERQKLQRQRRVADSQVTYSLIFGETFFFNVDILLDVMILDG